METYEEDVNEEAFVVSDEDAHNYGLCKELRLYEKTDRRYKELASEICENNARLITSIIKRYFPSYMKQENDVYDELKQQGVMGMLTGLQYYDPDKSKFSTFIYPYVLHEITDFINVQFHGLTSHYATNQSKIRKAIAQFEAEGKSYTVIDLSMKTGLKPESVAKSLQIDQRSNLMYYGEEDFLDAQFSEFFDSPEKQYLEKERTNVLREALNALTCEQKMVVCYRTGFDQVRKLSFREIADIMNKTPDELKKIYNDGIRTLKIKRELVRLFPDYLKRGRNVPEKNKFSVVSKKQIEEDTMAIMEALPPL